jgi:predicted transcriptional regulator
MANHLKPFRFFWRSADSTQFYPVKIMASEPQYGHLGMLTHIAKRLKREIGDVVVDHFFYRIDEAGNTADRFSLNDFDHHLQILCANRVWKPGEKPHR